MTLRENMESSGTWLFRWRSFLPLFLIAPILLAFKVYQYPYQSHRLDYIWEIGCVSISLFGLAIRFFTVGSVPKGTSGRNTKRVKGDFLNTTGIYSIVKHPLYLGNFVIGLGVSLFFRLWWVTSLFVLVFWTYYERIIFAEENFLQKTFSEKYLKWAHETPTFLPKLKNWKPPKLAFSFRTALRKEYDTFMAIIASFTFLEILGDSVVNGRLVLDQLWLILFLLSGLMNATLRMIDKKTKILRIDGR
ncbi:MAG: isoprenylcysteine carboxylmethyltransferase family protein [Thermodesulfobacteriota bacterium]|jgi:protein-S-isoprenylcysteine O-methyltransferase Ste14|nr:MAG: isoprenylcysteine carboxylmethyltransferase family protein [Thermodesulfobacteriota bacterium]